MLTLVIFLAVLALLVLVHEFGHFVTARKAGMKVYEFGFGFPPRVFGIQRITRKHLQEVAETEEITEITNEATGEQVVVDKIREIDEMVEKKKWRFIWGRETEATTNSESTIYSFNWLPLGGFVKIKGEDGEAANEPDSFGFKKAWKRVVVLIAGVTMNFILAGVLLGIGFMIGLPTDVSEGVEKGAILVEQQKVLVQMVEKDSPAEKAGIQFGDEIVSINNESVNSSQTMVAFVQAHSQEELVLKIKRGAEEIFLKAKPDIIKTGETTARLGVMLADAGVVRYPWYVAIYKGFIAAGIGLVNIFIAFFILIKNLIIGKGLAFDVSGPVGIAVMVGQSAKLGFNYLINVTAMISLSLAAINILPIPALDGGRILFIAIEKIIRRPVNRKYEQYAHMIGFALLMILIVVVTGRDILGLIK